MSGCVVVVGIVGNSVRPLEAVGKDIVGDRVGPANVADRDIVGGSIAGEHVGWSKAVDDDIVGGSELS